MENDIHRPPPTPILPLKAHSDLAVAGCLLNSVDIGSKL